MAKNVFASDKYGIKPAQEPAPQPQQAPEAAPQPTQAEYQPVYPGDKGPPPGIPANYWQEYLRSMRGLIEPAIKNGKDWYSIATNPNSKFSPSDAVTGTSFPNVFKSWNQVPDAQKQQFFTAEAEGAPFLPNTPEYEEWKRNEDVKDTRDTNQSTFEDWEDQFLPGVRDAMKNATFGDTKAMQELQKLLGGIKDPELAQYVGDYVSQAATAAPDARDVEAQQRQLAKLESLSDPTLTAEEKLMAEISRRQTESDLRAQRGAIKNDLQARGVYGSGAEIGMNLAAQQEAAQRQALEMLGAQSNAQQRAMQALKGAADLSTSMRGSSAQESQFRGTAADRATEWNKKLKQEYENWKTEQQFEANKDKVNRGEITFNAKTGVTDRAAKNALAPAELAFKAAAGKTGQLSGDTGAVSSSFHDTGVLFDKDRAEKRLEDVL